MCEIPKTTTGHLPEELLAEEQHHTGGTFLLDTRKICGSPPPEHAGL